MLCDTVYYVYVCIYEHLFYSILATHCTTVCSQAHYVYIHPLPHASKFNMYERLVTGCCKNAMGGTHNTSLHKILLFMKSYNSVQKNTLHNLYSYIMPEATAKAVVNFLLWNKNCTCSIIM